MIALSKDVILLHLLQVQSIGERLRHINGLDKQENTTVQGTTVQGAPKVWFLLAEELEGIERQLDCPLSTSLSLHVHGHLVYIFNVEIAWRTVMIVLSRKLTCIGSSVIILVS